MKTSTETQSKVGIFVGLGVVLLMISILMLGGLDGLITRKNTYTSTFKAVDGLSVGAKVMLAGLAIGQVTAIEFDPQDARLRVRYSLSRKYAEWIRTDSEIEILTQGVLGDKYLSLSPGSRDLKEMKADSEIPARPTRDLSQVLSKSDNFMVTLNSIASSLDNMLKSFELENRKTQFIARLASTAKNLNEASTKLNSEMQQLQLADSSKKLHAILEKINNGTGTLGALVNDPALYEDARTLLGGANRNRIIRNIVRKTVKDGDEVPATSSP